MMERRNRNIILFFEENEDVDIINSKLVRLYMNRFTINEEQRFEIIGVFSLTPVPKMTRVDHGDPRLNNRRLQHQKLCITKENWIKDQLIIKNAIANLPIYTKFHTDKHIIMGTSLYVGSFISIETLFKSLQNWSKDRWTYRSLYSVKGSWRPRGISISLTLLNGWNDGFLSKNEVKNAYRLNKRSNKNDKNSVNDDLENFVEDLSARDPWCNLTEMLPIKQELFLYEMLSEAEDEFQFVNSRCQRQTIYLK